MGKSSWTLTIFLLLGFALWVLFAVIIAFVCVIFGADSFTEWLHMPGPVIISFFIGWILSGFIADDFHKKYNGS